MNHDPMRSIFQESTRKILAEVLGVRVEDIDDEASMTTTLGWDSFAHTELCERVGEILGIALSDELIEACSSFKSLCQLFEAKSGSPPLG